MDEPERSMAARLHAIIQEVAPQLAPRTWYGMPAYARDGQVVCFFQSAGKFKSRYATFGFSDTARLDEAPSGRHLSPWSSLTGEVEDKIRALVKKAVGG